MVEVLDSKVNSDITMTDTNRAINQTKGREIMGRRVKHVIKEGSRKHVTHWDSNGAHCSKLNCEINKDKIKNYTMKKPTISQRLIKAIKTDLHFKDDMICFDMHRWSIKRLADYIILHRKEIGLYEKSDFEIDEADAKEAIWRTYIKLCNCNHINWSDEFTKAIVNKNPIKIKGEK